MKKKSETIKQIDSDYLEILINGVPCSRDLYYRILFTNVSLIKMQLKYVFLSRQYLFLIVKYVDTIWNT